MNGRAVTAIVLAGGRSSRFGRDKLVEPIAGRTLLEHAIEGVRPFARDIVVVRRPGDERPLAPDCHLVHDPSPFEGPLVGLLGGLTAATEPIVLVAAGDTPVLVPAVIEALLATLDDPGADAALLDRDGRSWPFPMVLRRTPAQAVAARLVAEGERRLLALPEALSTTVIAEALWRPLDPDGLSVHDIDTPEDLPGT